MRHQRINNNMPETTCFIAPIASRDDLKNAITSIVQHNTSAFEPLGYYTDAEYEALDPRRFKKYKSIKNMGLTMICNLVSVSPKPDGNGSVLGPFKSTRGENIVPGGCFVRFKGKLWLEVTNRGGGPCSTTWLKTNSPHVGWIGTEGKPRGFYDASCIGQAATLRELAALGIDCLDRSAVADEAGDYEAGDDEAGHVVADRDTGEVRMIRMVTKPEDLSHDTWQYMVQDLQT